MIDKATTTLSRKFMEEDFVSQIVKYLFLSIYRENEKRKYKNKHICWQPWSLELVVYLL